MPIFAVILLISPPCFAFLDFIGQQAKKAAEAAAYADAVAELAGEIAPESDIATGAKDIRKRTEEVRSQASNLRYIGRSTQSVLNGPDWSSKRLETNIRNTTDYIRRVKRLIGRITVLGTDGAIALNTTETNVALNEVQKNQQTLILQNSDSQLREIEKEQDDARLWSSFSDQQRGIRKARP